jgi:hypothetical protein
MYIMMRRRGRENGCGGGRRSFGLLNLTLKLKMSARQNSNRDVLGRDHLIDGFW